MKIKTTLFGEVEVDLVAHRRKQGLNNIVESIIRDLKSTKLGDGNTRITSAGKATLHMEIRDQLIG